MTDTVGMTWEGAVAHIRFNRPAVLNALNLEMAQGLLAICRELSEGGRVRAVLMSGEGRGFMAGGDVSTFGGDDMAAGIEELITAAHGALRLLAELPVPVIAAVQGAVAGAGVGIACGADVIIAGDDLKMRLAYSRLGTSPDCGTTWALPRALGLRRALGFALLEEVIDAPAALAIGLVNRVVPAAGLMGEARAIASRVALGATAALGRTKLLLRQSLDTDLVTQLAAEQESFLQSTGTRDFAEGVAAFRARRAPDFSGA